MRVVVGRIGKAHGIRGEVTVEVRTDEPERRFAPGSRLHVDSSSLGQRARDQARTLRGLIDGELIVESVRPHGGGLLIGFDGVTDRNTAEALRGILLEVDRDPDERPLDDDEYYDSDLIGCTVLDAEGRELGVVEDVVHLPGQDLLAVHDGQGREWLLPLVQELVPHVDLAERVVTAAPPEGLIGDA